MPANVGSLGHSLNMAAAETSECVFCVLPPERIMFSNEHAVAINDAFPVSPGHCLVIPRRHVADWWELGDDERASVLQLVDQLHAQLLDTHRPQGFNVGFNDGAAAGQTVFHFHMHVIPRYEGDVADPRGGVRHVIPAKANYLKKETE
jgi:diadenosine tetraphosphate (Ap4A) HIT family hydrolase